MEDGNNIKEEMIILSDIKIYREPLVEGRKPRFESTIWNIRKK